MVLIQTVKMRTMSYCGKTNLSLSLSLSENQFILYQFLVECLLISFENFNSRDLLTVPDLKLIKKKKMTSWLEWLMFISVCKLPLVTNLISSCSRCLPNVKILKSGVDIRYLTFFSCFGLLDFICVWSNKLLFHKKKW